MKFAIVAVVLSVCLVQSANAWWGGMYGMGYGWGGLYGMGMWGKRSTTEYLPIDSHMLPKQTECIWNRNTSTITCLSCGCLVECKTELIWPEEESNKLYILTGIAKSDTTPRSYRLLPRTLSNSNWLDNVYLTKQVSLFSSDDLDHFGLKVTNETCFNRVDKLLKMSTRNEKVQVISKDGLTEMPVAFIVGDLTAVDAPVADLVSEKSRERRTWGHHGGGHFGGNTGGGYDYRNTAFGFGNYGGLDGFGYYGGGYGQNQGGNYLNQGENYQNSDDTKNSTKTAVKNSKTRN
jgi:hypothetical protein